MPGRKITDETDAHACLEAAVRSGLPRAHWAHVHGVDARSLNAWRLNLERRTRRAVGPPELRLVELVSGPVVSRSSGSGVRLRIGEVVVEVERDFDVSTLGRVLDLMAPC